MQPLQKAHRIVALRAPAAAPVQSCVSLTAYLVPDSYVGTWVFDLVHSASPSCCCVSALTQLLLFELVCSQQVRRVQSLGSNLGGSTPACSCWNTLTAYTLTCTSVTGGHCAICPAQVGGAVITSHAANKPHARADLQFGLPLCCK